MNPVKELIELLDFGFKFQKGVTNSLSDGKLNYLDAPKFMPAITALPAAIMGADGILKLYQGFSDEQKQEIFDFIDQEFDIADDQKELLIEDTVKEIIGDFQVAIRWKNYQKAA